MFGIIYYAYRISYATEIKKKYEIENEKYNNCLRSFGDAFIAPVHMEKEVESIIKNRHRSGNEFDIISDNLTTVFGNNYEARFLISLTCNRTNTNVSSGYWAKHLILSKFGKVGILEYYGGYPIGVGDEVETNIKMCEQIEKNLRNANVGLRLVMQPGIREDALKLKPYGKNMVFEHTINCTSDDKEYVRLW